MKDIHVTAAQGTADEEAHVARAQQLADEIAELSLRNLLDASEETVAVLASELLGDESGSSSSNGITANTADPLADVDVGTGQLDDIVGGGSDV